MIDLIWWSLCWVSFEGAKWAAPSRLLRGRHWCQSVDHYFWRERRLGDAAVERVQQVQQVWAQAGGHLSLLRYPQPGRALQSASLAQQFRSATPCTVIYNHTTKINLATAPSWWILYEKIAASLLTTFLLAPLLESSSPYTQVLLQDGTWTILRWRMRSWTKHSGSPVTAGLPRMKMTGR